MVTLESLAQTYLWTISVCLSELLMHKEDDSSVFAGMGNTYGKPNKQLLALVYCPR